jgi:hypothetical protein
MFYKYENQELTSGPFVQMPDGFLHTDYLDTYEFPVNDWYYFETEIEAKEFFNIKDES